MTARRGKRGKPRHGTALKETFSVSLDPQVADNLRAMGRDRAGNDCLSRGIELAELIARGSPEIRRPRPVHLGPEWLVFELVDGPPDPPRAGEPIRLFPETKVSFGETEPLPHIFDPPL